MKNSVKSGLPKFRKRLVFHFLISVLGLLYPLSQFANGFEFVDKIYRSNIRTVTLHPAESPVSPPYMQLYSDTRLVLQFDDLDADYKSYYYTVIHCSSEWEPSDIYTSDFLNGFPEMNISEYDQSFSSAIPYTHYQVSFPSEEMQPKLSGNYLFCVYLDGDMDQPILSRRFVIYENLVFFKTRVKESTQISEYRYMQEVDVNVLHPDYQIPNPYTDFRLAILQNYRWDNAITELDPLYVRNLELVYDYGKENNFNGGNEFRFFDLKSLRYANNEVGTIFKDNEGNPHAMLVTDEMRTFQNYRSDRDINGQYLVKNDDGFNDATESQYVMVHFSLKAPQAFPAANVYIFGELSLWNYDDEFKMTYNANHGMYEAEVLLKHGYYNYCYMVKTSNESYGDESLVEGNHAATENSYAIFAYNYEINGGYDRVVGAAFTDSYNR